MRRMSFLLQLILGFSFIFISILTITNYISYRVSSELLMDNSTQHLQESLSSFKGRMDSLLAEYDRLTLRVAVEPTIQEHLRSRLLSTQSRFVNQDIEHLLARQSRYGGYNFLIQVMDEQGMIYKSDATISMLLNTKEQFAQQVWYQDALKMGGRMSWIAGMGWNNGYTPAVIGIRQINDFNDMKRLGDIAVTIPIIHLTRAMEESRQTSIAKLYIFDYLGNVMFSNSPGDIGQPAPESLTRLTHNRTDGLSKIELDGQQYYMAYTKSDQYDLSMMAFIEPDVVIKDMQQTQFVTLFAVVAGTLLSIALVIFFSWTVTKPIRYLSMRLHRIPNGNLTPIKDRQSNREVQALVDSYNQMIMKLNETIEELSASKMSQQEANVIAWKAQFRPHFLYNTLNTIYWVLTNEGQERTADMVLKLSSLLRYSIQPGSEIVTVREELLQLNAFLELQQLRYGEQFQPIIDIPEEIKDRTMMKMLFQPIVENAITHGLEQVHDRQWIIRIRAMEEGEWIRIIIEDNGVGMSEEAIQTFHRNEPLTSSKQQGHSGLGLQNVKNRLGYLYGESHKMNLSRSELGGLRIDILQP
jgi:two-component system sensor histidine kinase YesM